MFGTKADFELYYTTIKKCCAVSGELHKQPHRVDPAEIAPCIVRACNAKVAEAFLIMY